MVAVLHAPPPLPPPPAACGLRFRGTVGRKDRSRVAVADAGGIAPRCPFVSDRLTLEQRAQLQQEEEGAKSSAAIRVADSALQLTAAATWSTGLVEQKRRPGREEAATMTGGRFAQETEPEAETETEEDEEAAISPLEASTALLYSIRQPYKAEAVGG